jgi:hypothetical protein
MQYQYERNTKLLWGLVVLALGYSYWLYYFPALTGLHRLDGSIGVIMGLYTCSRPAANAVDMVFFERHSHRRVTSKWSEFVWLALNIVVMGLGCFVIVTGAIRLVG